MKTLIKKYFFSLPFGFTNLLALVMFVIYLIFVLTNNLYSLFLPILWLCILVIFIVAQHFILRSYKNRL